MEKSVKLPKVVEFIDNSKEHRIRVTAQNGNILQSSPEGYKNKQDCINSSVSASIAILSKYMPGILNQEL